MNSNAYAEAVFRIPPEASKKKAKRELPAPLVKPYRHPIKFAKNAIKLLVAGGLFTYIGILVIAALYYLSFEVFTAATEWWHHTVPNSDQRHNIRDVGEGLLGGLFAVMIRVNHYKKNVTKKRNILDKIEIALHIPNIKDDKTLSWGQAVLLIPLVLLYAVPGFLIGEAIVNAIHPFVHMSTDTSFLGHIKGVVTENYPKKLIGFGAAFFFGRRPAMAVFDDLQLWFAERRVALCKPIRWYHSPTFAARYNDVCKNVGTVGAEQRQSTTATVISLLLMTLGVALAVFGFIAINYNTILK